MFERLTKRARNVVSRAQKLAAESAGAYIEPEHLLLALLEDEKCLAVRVLSGLGAPPSAVRENLDRAIVPRDSLDEEDVAALDAIGIDLGELIRRVEENLGGSLGPAATHSGRPRFSAASKKVLEISLRQAIALKHNYLGTEHILLALARGGDRVVTDTFADLGLSHQDLRRSVVEALRQAG